MTPEESLFAEALSLPDEGRAAFLEEACGGQPELRSRVEALLRSQKADGFMEGPGDVDETIHSMNTAPDWARALPERPGTRIGRYRLLQQIGEGGFGVVWMAEQVEPVTRRVALKIIRAGMDTQEVIARFKAERQALALMEHPNIAKVFDAGATEQGRPYLVMELVKGIPITQFCDDQSLTTRQRLELFGDVCAAINHAHQKGVIHRDIKPSNVMVTLHCDQPVVKIIDFGIAKATQGRLTDKTFFTRFEQFVGTPAYMSPEQSALGGLDMDTRSDIYALGVLLYELLTGGPPFEPESLLSAGYEEMRRIIQEVDPPKPSARLHTIAGPKRTAIAKARHIEPEKLGRLVEPDLDWIVMRAIEKDRNRRYDTANAFAADVRRYLKDEPVEACPPSTAYRLKKTFRQHKGPVLSAALLMLALLAGVIGTTLGLLQAQHEAANADNARGEQQLARTQAEAARDREKLAHAQTDSARRQAENKSAESHNRLVRHLVANGTALVGQGDPLGALPWFTEALKEERGNTQQEEIHRIRLSTIFQQVPRLKQVWFHDRHMIAYHAEFSPTGRHVVIASGVPNYLQPHYGEARIWDAETGNAVSPPLRHEHNHPILKARFSPDGLSIATAGGGYLRKDEQSLISIGEARLWDAITGKPLTQPLKSNEEIKSLVFNTKGDLILTVAGSHCRVWNASTGEAAGPVNHDRANFIAFSPNGKRVAVAARLNAYVADAITGKAITPLLKHTYKPVEGGMKGEVTHIAFNTEGTQVVTASKDESARIWDATTGNPLTPSMKHDGSVNHVTFSTNGKLVVTASEDGNARIWNAKTGVLEVPPIRHSGAVTHALFSADGKKVATISGTAPLISIGNEGSQVAQVWDSATGRPLSPPLRHQAHITSTAFSPDGSRLLTSSADRAVRLWELDPVGESTVPFFNDAPASHGAISPDVSLVATKHADERAFLWILDSVKKIALEGKFSGHVQYLAFSADGKRVPAANGSSPWGPFTSDDTGESAYVAKNQASVYDTATGKPVGPPLKHDNTVLHASFSPRAERIVTASEDKTARVWDLATGEALGPPLKHNTAVRYVAWCPDGKRVATAAWDDGVCIWDAASGEQFAFFAD
jgi:WD40 repeat protein/serine/threonine protein kinase